MKHLITVILLLAVVSQALPQGNDAVKRQADQIWAQAGTLHEKEKYSEAIALLVKNKDLFIKVGDYYYAAIAKWLGTLYLTVGDNVKAESSLLEAKDIYGRVYGKEYSDYIEVLEYLGNLYGSTENYAKAEPYFLELKTYYEKANGKNSHEYAVAVFSLGYIYVNLSDNAKAETYLLESKNLYEKIFGKQHGDYAIVLDNLGSLYEKIGNYAKAEPYYLESLGIYEKLYGKNSFEYAKVLGNLGNIYFVSSNYNKAEPCLSEAKTIFEKIDRKEYEYAGVLDNLGSLNMEIGKYEKAETYYLEAKTLLEKVYGKNDLYYAHSLVHLGDFYGIIGDYAKSESCYLEAKTAYEKNNKREIADYAFVLINLARLYKSLGDNIKAESYLLEGKEIEEKIFDKTHPEYAAALVNLAELYLSIGEYGKAEPLFVESKNIYEKAFGKKHIFYASVVDSLGFLYYLQDDYAKAEAYYLEARTVYEQLYGKRHSSYAMTSGDLGLLFHAQGNYTKAESYYLESKNIYEQVYGKNHMSYIWAIGDLAVLYQSIGNYAKAEALNKEMCELGMEQINRNFSFMSENQRGLFVQALLSLFKASYSLSMKNPVEAVNGLNYTNTLFTKGLLLRTTNAVRDAIYSSGDKALIEQFEQLLALRQRISQLQQKEDADKKTISALEEQADALDKALTLASAAFRDLKADMAIQWQDVKSGLQQGEAAVEFVSFQVYDKKWTDKIQYAAFVLKPDSKAPVWIPLCDEEDLREILNKANGKSSSEQARILYSANGLRLFDVLWEPIEKELAGVKTIYYSPSGLLHKIAFNALPVDDSFEVRLADKYNLNLVSSTREVTRLTRSKTETTQITSAVLYGGLDYNADAKKMRSAASPYRKGETQSIIASATIAGVTRSGGGGAWVPLPATRKEVQNIQSYLKKKKIPNTLYQDSLGNEESFKQLSGKKTGLIHLATHGFFSPDSTRRHDDTEQQQRGGVLKAADNPLLRSGLLLAGGNHAWTKNPVEGVDSGVLTADKIAGMNLVGTKLVVMSACQTGLGDINNGEGVFGLQRAFKLAGVETLIMSLWEVDDKATALLMSTFYNEWLFSGKSRQEAFKEAQKKVRAKYPLPYYWAAFVMMD